jgi:hypothetical protein
MGRYGDHSVTSGWGGTVGYKRMTSLLIEAEINRNIQWLCDNGSAPVRYLTHKYLLRTPTHSKQMIKLWLDVVDCPEAIDIFSKQRPDGSWYSAAGWMAQLRG